MPMCGHGVLTTSYITSLTKARVTRRNKEHMTEGSINQKQQPEEDRTAAKNDSYVFWL